MNAKHGLSNPYQADKRRTLQEIDTKALNRNETKEEINKHIEELVIAQKLQNRDEVVQYFKSSGIDVVRQSKNFITIELDKERIRLKGDYYAETFKDYGTVAEKLQRAEREHIPTTRAEYRELEQEFDKLVQYKAQTNREKYPNLEQHNDREYQSRTKDTKKEQDNQVHKHSSNELDNRLTSNLVSKAEPSRNSSADRSQVQRDRELKVSEQAYRGKEELTSSNRTTTSNENSEQRIDTRVTSLEHTKEYEKNRQRGNISKNETRLPRRGNELQVGNDKGLDDDIIRENASRRTRGREEIQQRTLTSTKAEPNGVYRGIAKNFNNIREHHKADKERLQVPAGELEQEVRGLHEQRSNGISSIKERVGTVVNQAKEYIEIAKAKAKEVWQKLQESLERQKAIEKALQEKEQAQSRSRGGMSLSR